MNRLVPFPEAIGSFTDADLLDLNVIVRADVFGPNPERATVKAAARYATGARLGQVCSFYQREFESAGASVTSVVETGSDDSAVLSAVLADDVQTAYTVSVKRYDGYRSVKVSVRYGDFAYQPMFERFASWHNGNVPVPDTSQPTGLEISTFAVGRRPSTVVLYSTEYECPRTPRLLRREMVVRRIGELGWTYLEPRDGIMFIQDGFFDAETHVAGDETGSSVTFVGEFRLR